MEELRLAATRELGLLDTEPEPEFDELVRLAASICNTPMSTITLLDERRQWFKAKYGISQNESPREISFCTHTIRESEMLVIEDATKDKRFCSNPLVTAKNGLRFYAGMPVSGRDGLKIGTLCVLDTQPRSLSGEQRQTLEVLARQVGAQVELRLQKRELHRALEERTALAAELGASDQLFRTFMHYSPMASFIKDDKGRLVFYNRRMAESAGIDMDSAIGLTDAELWPENIARTLQENDQRALRAEKAIEIDEVTEVEGKKTEWRCFKFPWRNSAGDQMLAGIAIDVTAERKHQAELRHYQKQLEEANARLTWSANTDPLTGLANRRALDDGIEAATGTPVMPGREIAVLTIDVDHFKHVNDTFGHAYGDLALRQIANVLTHCTRAQDLVARSGGEEFTIMLPASGPTTAMLVAERILSELRDAPWEHYPISVSIGVSTATIDDRNLSCVMERSDRALYQAKQQGRNRAVYLTKSNAVQKVQRVQPSRPEKLARAFFLPGMLAARLDSFVRMM